MTLIYHLTTPESWQQAQAIGEYRAESLAHEGFIHASTSTQVIPVANAFYCSVAELILLCIDSDRLVAEVRWEDPAPPALSISILDGEKFPHIYGAINLDAVLRAIALSRNNQSTFILPDHLPR
jgi:uncharacterized protein (DUF952 family)